MTANQDDLSRRDLLWQCGGGLGGLALASLLGADSLLADPPRPEFNGGLHHPARVRRVIQLFMNGGVSQVDTFDPKPELDRKNGEKFDPGERVESVTNSPGYRLLKSPFRFQRHGRSGRWVSEVFPQTAGCVDDLTFLLSMTSSTNVHGTASYLMNTGFVNPGFPALGAWLSYGLGRLTDELPTFVVLPDGRGLPYNGLGNFSSGFLPVTHQGTVIRATAPTPIAHLAPPPEARFATRAADAEGLSLLKQLNREHLRRNEGDSRLDSRIAAYELAAKLQLHAPAALSVANETPATRKLYGLDQKETEDFGGRCLVARRLIERGVRFVQVWSGAGGPANNWDNHGNIKAELPPIARSVDQPIAGLLRDLKARGLLADTLVLFSTEFGRQPFSQGTAGRDHNAGTFVGWLAGAGVRPGTAIGESDRWGWKARTPITTYDLHATVLHLLGIDHEKLTLRHNGSNRRLTDVHGKVLRTILS